MAQGVAAFPCTLSRLGAAKLQVLGETFFALLR
jgi:hypothetical protein